MFWDRLQHLNPWLIDALVVLGVAVVVVGKAGHEGYSALLSALAIVQVLALILRRVRPLPVLAIVLAAWLAGYLVHGVANPAALLVALYTVAAHVPRRLSIAAGAVTLAAVFFPLVHDSDNQVAPFVFKLATFAGAWIFGDNRRTRRAYVRELVARAERLEREREANARRAAAEEQARIARELHDVIAHNVSVMVVQAAAAEDVFDEQPERAREAVRSIEQTGRAALTELRRLLGVIRAPAEETRAPQPGLGGLQALADQVRAAGLPVTLRMEGELEGLPAGLELSAYRIVQEALTNTLKHAGAKAAEVTVGRTEAGIELEIRDDGAGSPADGEREGHGLVGMRERAALLGGEVAAGPLPGGGFSVRARLPLNQGQPV